MAGELTSARSIHDAILHFSGQAEQLSSAVEHPGALVQQRRVLCHRRFQVATDVSVCGYELAGALEAFVAAAESSSSKML